MDLVDLLLEGQVDPPLSWTRRALQQGVIAKEHLNFRLGGGLERLGKQYTDYMFCISFCGAPSTVSADLLSRSDGPNIRKVRRMALHSSPQYQYE